MKKWMTFIGISLFLAAFFHAAQAYEVLNGPSQLIRYKASKAYEGYTLFSSQGQKKTYLIDMLGNVVHTWEHKTDPPGLKSRKLKPLGLIEEDIKDGWKPRVDLEGATQPGAKLWEKIWQ